MRWVDTAGGVTNQMLELEEYIQSGHKAWFALVRGMLWQFLAAGDALQATWQL
jgi:hypothetical protein